jgi:hypothetical protein
MTSTVNAGNTSSMFSNPADWLFPKKQEHDATQADQKKKEQQVSNEDNVTDAVQKGDVKQVEDSKDDAAHAKEESVADLLFKDTPSTEAKPSEQDDALPKEELAVKPETATLSEATTPEQPQTTEQHLNEEDHAPAEQVAEVQADAPVAEQSPDQVKLPNLGGMEVDHVDLAIVSVHKAPVAHGDKPVAQAAGNADAHPMPLENFWKMLSSLINFHLDNDHGAGQGSTFPVSVPHGFFHPFGLGGQHSHESQQPGNHGGHRSNHFM